MHYAKLCYLLYSLCTIRMTEARKVILVGVEVKNNACSSNGNPEGRKRLSMPKYKWEDNIKVGVGEIGWDTVN